MSESETKWTICHSEADRHVALQLCQGDYQRGLVMGTHNLSATTATVRFRRTYKQSAMALIARIRAAGVEVSEARGPRGARILVLGKAPSTHADRG